MKIEFVDQVSTTPLGEAKAGEVVRTEYGKLLMRTDPINQMRELRDQGYVIVVDLQTGRIYALHEAEQVTQVSAKLTVQGSPL